MTVPTHQKLYSDIFTHERGSVSWCVFYTAQNLQGKLHCWACIFRPDGKSSVFLPVKIIEFQPQTLWIIYITAKTLVEHLNFLRETGSLPPFAGNISDITVWPNQSNNRYGSQHSKNTLPKHFFSWKCVVCPVCLWHCLETSGKLLLWSWVLCLMARAVFFFSLWKQEICNLRLPEEHSVSFISSLKLKI